MIEYGSGDENKINPSQRKNAKESSRNNPDPDFSYFFEFSSEIFFIADINFKIQKANLNWQKLLGYSPGELIGSNLTDILKNEKFSEFCEDIQNGIIIDKDISFTCSEKTKSGEIKWFLWSLKPENGFIYGRASDISSKKETEERFFETEERFQFVLDHIPQKVFWKDINSKYVGCNKRFAQLAGIKSPKDIVGKTDFELPWRDSAREYSDNDLYVMENNIPQLSFEKEINTGEKHLWIKINKIPLHDAENRIIGLLGTFEDITKRKDEESALRRSEERFRSLFENSLDAIGVTSQSGEHLFVNKAYMRLFGYSDYDEIIKKKVSDLLADESRTNVENYAIENPGGTLEPLILEVTGLRKDGSKFILNVHASVFEFEGVSHTLNILRDLTERSLLEKKLSESEMKYRTISENTYDWEFWVSPDEDFIYVSPSCKKITGYDREQFLSDKKLLGSIIYSEDRISYLNHAIRAKYEQISEQISFRIIRSDGEIRWIEHACTPVYDDKQKFIGTRGSNRDVTENKTMEEKLRNREATLRAVLDSITEFTVLVDINGKINTANETAARMLNSTVDNLIGVSISDLMDKPILEKNKNYIKEAAATKKPVRFEESENGVIFDVTIYPVLEENGVVNRFVILLNDITAKREAFDAVHERDAMLSALINATTESAFLIDANGKILIANDTVANRFGTSVSDFIGQYLYDLLTTENAVLRKKYIDNVIETGQPIRFEDRRGNLIIDNSIYPVFDKDGKVVQMALFGSDITSRKHAEEEIKLINKKLLDLNSTKDKFFSIIAHDLRSPFQGLLGYSQILIDEFNELSETEKKQYIHNISDISKSSYKLLENLLQWSRMQTGNFEFNPEVLNISEELMPTIDLLKTTALNKSINIISSLRPKTYVMADKNMLTTIVRNLVSNSIKFTKPNGTIWVSSSELNEYVVISIKDNGVGMEAEKLKNLFKPVKNISTLGTAKEKGTGLGLLLCKEMVDKHNGEIWVESEPDNGSTFYFTLPIRI